MSHTILLFQPSQRLESRTYSDYESLRECLEGICRMYEQYLKQRNPKAHIITYDMSNLFEFLDQLTDLSCLVYQKETNTYVPYNKEWVKKEIYVMMRQQAVRH